MLIAVSDPSSLMNSGMILLVTSTPICGSFFDTILSVNTLSCLIPIEYVVTFLGLSNLNSDTSSASSHKFYVVLTSQISSSKLSATPSGAPTGTDKKRSAKLSSKVC